MKPSMRPAASLLGIGLVLIAHAAHAACPAPIGLADVSQPTTVVGVDVPCTEQGLAAALTTGGVVTFACGPGPVTLPITSAKAITQDTVLDGGGLVTLDGGHESRILSVPSSFELGTPRLTVQRIRFVRGNSSAVSGEDTARGGGAIWVRGGSLRVVATEFVDNRGPATGQDVAGGAIYSAGTGEVTIVASLFTGNQASNGGAIGVLFADLTLVDTMLADNAATGSGGNPGQGGNGGGIYSDGNDQIQSLCGVSLVGNHANAFGGGMFRVSNNGVGPLSILETSVLSNRIPDQATSMAGGMYLQGVQIQIQDSTIAWNEARSAGGLFLGPNGTTIEATNVTIAENTALSSLAGGLAISAGVTGVIRHATIARNAAPGPVAFAAATTGGGSVVLANSIVDGHVAGNAWNPISCLSPLVEGGGNLQWPILRASGQSDAPDALCSAAITTADSELGALQDNGGPTLTIEPAATSPASIPRGGCPDTDQRGRRRDTEACTAGAVEKLPEPTSTLAATALVATLAWRRRRARQERGRVHSSTFPEGKVDE
ncbi:hypothetical protein KJ059_15375 [Myxococcota bacterium]|nr:hypothetical protein [Myxococcota bacterium]MCZ7617096.1 hypothetical protein [Myxococcota bacterium]